MMTTLVGRECWTTLGVLKHGKVAEQKFNPDYCVILYDDGERGAGASQSLCLTLDAAIIQCGENAEYWMRKQNELERKKQELEDALVYGTNPFSKDSDAKR